MKRFSHLFLYVFLAAIVCGGLMFGYSFRHSFKSILIGGRSYVQEAFLPATPHWQLAWVKPGDTKQRLYVIHGAEHTADQWKEKPFDIITNGPYQVVAISIPQLHGSFFNDGGSRYCSDFSKWMNDLDQTLDHRYGQAKVKMIAGISWGGFHAMVASRRLPWVTRWASLSPVTDPSALTEMWWVNADQCSPFVEKTFHPGMVTYSTDDKRVDATEIERYVNENISHHVIGVPNHGLGHTTSDGQAWDVRTWLETGRYSS